mmetsp:Transcript_6483/g.11002  ORF Transcript_6483/g.11002 Transcript_6483/m.11002 type:complete len:269 (-) Transcript_6483:821-1627(-)
MQAMIDGSALKSGQREQITPRKPLKPINLLICDLFRTVAEVETQIEKLRHQLCSQKDFDPRTTFNHVNVGGTRYVSSEELTQFMEASFIAGVSEEVVAEIISEFDSDQDCKLSYDEFLNLFLPATNNQLRSYVLYNKKKPSAMKLGEVQPGLPLGVAALVTRILELERQLAEKKFESRKGLFLHPNFILDKQFDTLTHGRRCLNMMELSVFMEKSSGFSLKPLDLEAILRRCDHDADRRINFQEFCELFYYEVPNPAKTAPPEPQQVQ